jgi:hypothetical protein
MERLGLLRDRLVTVEVAGLPLFSMSAWVGGAAGLSTGAILGATVGALGTGSVIGGIVGMSVGYTVGKSLKSLESRLGTVLF